MNKEKFLDKIGLLPKWTKYNYREYGIIYSDAKDDKLPIIQHLNINIRETETEGNVIVCAPDMLCALVESCMQFHFYAVGHFANDKIEKYKTNYAFFKSQKEIVEKATGMTWEQILKIAEECKE